MPERRDNDEFNRFLEELKYKCDIVNIVSQYLPLEKRSGKYFGCCPFHNEKTASFCVNSDGQYYHCFGCGVSGNVINFIMEMESLPFIDAVKFLADKAGMSLPEYKADPNYAKKKERGDVLKQLMRDAARFYRNNLLREKEGKEAREYLENRGINAEVAKRYGLGLSLDYDSLQGYMRRKGYSVKDLRDCGMVVGESLGDAFANRIIVPIFNAMNDVVAFGGRVYHGEKDVAKYKNSTNTALFDKGHTVYGANFVKKEKQRGGGFKDIILVEGYMDVIALGAAGIRNAVAGMGTALTEAQANEIKRLASNVYVCYDGDAAGRKAAVKNVEPLLKCGAEVKVVSLDDGQDPDDTVRAEGYGGFMKRVSQALPVLDFKLKLCENAYDLKSVNGRAKYVTAALKVLKGIGSRAEREVYLQNVSDVSGVGADILKRELAAGAVEKSVEKLDGQSAEERAAKAVRATRFVLNRLLENAEYAEVIQLKPDWLLYDVHKAVLAFVGASGKGKVVAGNLFEYLIQNGLYKTDASNEDTTDGNDGKIEDTDVNGEINKIFDIKLNFDNKMREAEYYFDCLNTIANEYISGRLEFFKQKFNNLTDSEEKRNCIVEIGELNKKLKSRNIADKL
jgi:DNA primase